MKLKHLKLPAVLLIFFMIIAFSIKIVSSNELPIKLFKLKYMRAKETVPLVKMFLSKDGRIEPDERLNALLIADYDENLANVQEFLDKYDIMPPNVTINAKIVLEKDLSRSGLLINWQVLNNYWRVGIVSPGSYTLDSSLETILLVMSGYEGKIITGTNVILPQWFYSYSVNYGYIAAQTIISYSVDSGLIVTPRVIGETDEIELTVNPFISYSPGGSKLTVVRYGEIETVVKVKSGQTVVLGGVQEEKNNIVTTVLNGAMKQTEQSNFVVVLTAAIVK